MPRGAVSSGMHWLADLRHALRLLGLSPLFTITSVLSLAAGLAVPSAVMSLADALLAPASGVRDADRLVDIGRSTNGGGFDNMTHPAFEYLRAHATTFDGMAAVDFGGRPMSYTSSGTSERVFGTLVSASFFDVLGAPMALGRGFRADEDVTPGARPVAVLTHRFWTERLRADPAAVGRSLRLNAHDFTVVGVAATYCAISVRSSASAVSRVTPGFRRPRATCHVARALVSRFAFTRPRASASRRSGSRRGSRQASARRVWCSPRSASTG